MNRKIKRALKSDRTIDITTTGRKTGRPRRIEIWFHNLDGRIFITGLPGKRDWYANLRADSAFILHLKGSVKADLPARATLILEEDERRAILSRITRNMGRESDLDAWVAESPLVEVNLWI
jgi:deazaflavin-dependent oxidoreductase (nitroreductase family)